MFSNLSLCRWNALPGLFFNTRQPALCTAWTYRQRTHTGPSSEPSNSFHAYFPFAWPVVAHCFFFFLRPQLRAWHRLTCRGRNLLYSVNGKWNNFRHKTKKCFAVSTRGEEKESDRIHKKDSIVHGCQRPHREGGRLRENKRRRRTAALFAAKSTERPPARLY